MKSDQFGLGSTGRLFFTVAFFAAGIGFVSSAHSAEQTTTLKMVYHCGAIKKVKWFESMFTKGTTERYVFGDTSTGVLSFKWGPGDDRTESSRSINSALASEMVARYLPAVHSHAQWKTVETREDVDVDRALAEDEINAGRGFRCLSRFIVQSDMAERTVTVSPNILVNWVSSPETWHERQMLRAVTGALTHE